MLSARWERRDRFAEDYHKARQAAFDACGRRAARRNRLLYFKRMLETATGSTDMESALRLQDAYWEGYFAEMRPDAGCLELLSRLRQAGVRLGWATNFTAEMQMKKLIHLGLQTAADIMTVSEEIATEKPEPELLDVAMQRLDVQPADTWMIGDNVSADIAAAYQRNLTSIWMARGEPATKEGGFYAPDFIVNDWSEIADIFEDMGAIS